MLQSRVIHGTVAQKHSVLAWVGPAGDKGSNLDIVCSSLIEVYRYCCCSLGFPLLRREDAHSLIFDLDILKEIPNSPFCFGYYISHYFY